MLVQRVSDLEEEVARLETWNAEKKRYQLAQIVPGVTALPCDRAWRTASHLIKFVATATGHNKKSAPKGALAPFRCTVLVCHECGAVLYEKGQPHPDHKSMRPRLKSGAT
jgi:hypothetical protein